MRKLIASLIVIIILVGCASTKVTGFRDREYIIASYVEPVIDVRVNDFQHKVQVEDLFVKEFSDRGISVIKGTSLYPPTRKYTAEELAKIFVASSADSMIIVSLKEGSSEEKQIWSIKVLGKDIGKVVWTGESKTKLVEGNILDGMNLGTMFKSISKNVVDRLIEDKIFKGRIVKNQ